MTAELLLQVLTGGVLIGGLYGLAALGLTLIFGVLKIINFAHGVFLMLGMYSTYWLFQLYGVDPYLSILIVLPLFFLMGALTQRLFLRRAVSQPEEVGFLITVGLALIIENAALILWSPDHRSVRVDYEYAQITVGGLGITVTRALAFLAAFVFAAVLYYIMRRTELGRAIRAVTQDQVAAALVGTNVRRIYQIAFGFGIAAAAVAGTAATPLIPVAPDVGHTFLLLSFVTAVLGGLGSFWGAFSAGIIIGVVEAMGSLLLEGSMGRVPVFVAFLLVIFLRPEGLFNR